MYIQSTPKPISTTPPKAKQFLFRVYHSPIQSELQTMYPIEETDPGELSQQITLDWSDHLCTLPGGTEDFVTMASRLAFASAVIGVNYTVDFVYCWQVKDGRPADEKTPVTLFHGLTNHGVREEFDAWQFAPLNENDPKFPMYGESIVFGQSNTLPIWEGFRTYDLIDSGPDFENIRETSEPFMPCIISRECKDGPYQLKMMKRTVVDSDWYINHKGQVVYNPYGTLEKTRFAFWKQVIETLPFTHSGWSLQIDGSIERRTVALTDRNMMGVSDFMQAKRMHSRRHLASGVVLGAWHITVKRALSFLRVNEIGGHPRPVANFADSTNTTELTYLEVPHAPLRAAVWEIMDFINLTGVATGNNYLLISDPEWSANFRLAKYQKLCSLIELEPGLTDWYEVKGLTKQIEVVEGMLDLIQSILFEIQNYQDQLYIHSLIPTPPGQFAEVQHSLDRIAIHNAFAAKWEEIQADFIALVGLLGTWQLTFDLAEPTRAGPGQPVIRRLKYPKYPQRLEPKPAQLTAKVTRAPDLEGRFAWDFPEFIPFRIQGVTIPPTNADSAFLEALRSASLLSLQQNLADVAADEAQRWQDRRDKRNAEIAALQADRIANNVPNPADPWDWRNYSRYDYWVTPLKRGTELEFTARMLDVPDEVDTAKDLFGYGSKVLHAARRKEPIVVNAQELTAPVLNQRKINGPLSIRRYIYRVARDIVVKKVEDYKGKVYDDVLGAIAGPNEPYSDRQVWPV